MKSCEEFNLESFIEKNISLQRRETDKDFQEICSIVMKRISLIKDSDDSCGMERQLAREKGAIIGKTEDVRYFKDLISEVLKREDLLSAAYPEYYPSLIDAVFHENWGLAGIAPWVFEYGDRYRESSSAKIIGDRIYFLEDGREVLQKQSISRKRRLQLKKALLLDYPQERLEHGFHEVYLSNGIRVTIYSGDRTKAGQEVIVFRKYIVDELTFEDMAKRATIPADLVEIFKQMCKIGFNVLFSGQVRSGKTTFLICWQKYEDPCLEGVAISTDPEIPWHKIMPDTPIMQLVADGEKLKELTKSLMRGDNDYIVLEEMRDAAAYRLALELAGTGSKRSKATIHSGDPTNIAYKMASSVYEKYGGDLEALIQEVYFSFDFVFEFIQLPEDRSKKKLKSISQMWLERPGNMCRIKAICEYDFLTGQCHYSSMEEDGLLATYPEKTKEIKELIDSFESLQKRQGKRDLLPVGGDRKKRDR